MKLSKEQREILKKAKILLYDLEVSPQLVYTYGYYETNVLKIVEPQKLLCFSYKWLGDTSKPQTKTLIGYSGDPKDDRGVVFELWQLLNECSMAIAHNGNRFDGKMANMFFVRHGMNPPAPYKMIDTLTAARQKFKFPSNKLDEIGKFLNVGAKTETTYAHLWEDCMKGDKKAYKKMAKYCANDVALMEKIYWKLMPFAQQPLINKLVNEELVCPTCGSTKFHRHGIVPDATVGPSWRYDCVCCGKTVKVPMTKAEKEENGFLKPLNRNISGCF